MPKLSNPKTQWALKQLKVRMKGVSSADDRTKVMRKVWQEAKAKFG